MAEGEAKPFRVVDQAQSLMRGRRPESDAFDSLLAEGIADGYVEERSALRWSSTINEESATWLGTWIDLAESGETVRFSTILGLHHQLHITAVGPDVIAGTNADGASVLVALSTIESAHIAGRRVAASERETAGMSMQRMLVHIAGDRPTVRIRMVSGTSFSGTLLNVGADVMSIRSDQANTIVIPICNVAEVIRNA
jgi:hypothetical protein